MSAPYILGQTLGTPRNNFSGYVGIQFDTGTNTPTVTSLGRWKVSGNTDTHNLYLMQFVDGSSDIQLGTVSVDMTTGADGDYLYADLGVPVVLAASTQYYVISQETASGDQWYDDDTTVDTITPGVATVIASVFAGPLGTSSVNNIGSFTYVPVNFKIATAPPPVTTKVLIEGSDDAQVWQDFSNGGVTATVAKDLIPGIRFWRTNIVSNGGIVTSSVGAVPLKHGGTKGLNNIIRTQG